MEIGFSVRLPVDADSVPFVRWVCRQALEHLGVEPLAVQEIALALSEACANVVRHAADRAEYEVEVDVSEQRCRIAVRDGGTGFDPSTAEAGAGSVLDEGRGVLLMRALVDELQFTRDADGRHCVVFDKRLVTDRSLRLVHSS